MQKIENHLMNYQCYKEWHADGRTVFLGWAIVAAFFGLSLDLISFSNEMRSTHESLSAGVIFATQVNEKRLTVTEATKESDRIIVKYKRSVPGLSIAKERANIEKAEKLDLLGEISGIDTLIYKVDARNTSGEVIDRIKANHGNKIEYAEVDMLIPPTYIPNDPSAATAWHISKVRAPLAWDSVRGEGVIIGIADTGVNCAHPDLAINCISGWNVVSNNTETTDINGHGTAVAGTAAAVGENGVGSAGIAYRAKIMPLRITNDTTGYAWFSDVARAVTYAADHGVRVVSNSYGTTMSYAVQDAATYLRSKGGVLIVAGGNDNAELIGSNPDTITTTSATDSADVKASFSNYGNSIDVAAPGKSIYATTRTGGYGNWSGTSFATPITAGVYALIFSAKPSLSPIQADEVLFSMSDDLGTPGWDMYYGYGRVNAAKAINTLTIASSTINGVYADRQAPTIPTNLVVSGVTSSQAKLTWSPSMDDVLVSHYNIYRNNVRVGTTSRTTLTNTKLTEKTTYAYAVSAEDAKGNESAKSPSVTIVTPEAPLSITSTSVSSKTTNTATISVKTSKPSQVMVRYGLTSTTLTETAYSNSTEAMTHSVLLTGLSTYTKYYYQVIATTSAGELKYGTIKNFITNNL